MVGIWPKHGPSERLMEQSITNTNKMAGMILRAPGGGKLRNTEPLRGINDNDNDNDTQRSPSNCR